MTTTDRRRCDWCGDSIDPKDWHPHPTGRGMKRSDAKYCNDACRSLYWQDVRKLRRTGKGLGRVRSLYG